MSTVEINQQGVSVSVHQGFLCIEKGEQAERIPLELVDCIIINSYGANITNNSLIRLCELCIPLIVCGKNGIPVGILNSSAENVYRKERVFAQISSSLPLQKNLWQTVIKAKIANQGLLLKSINLQHRDFIELEKKVVSGDVGNKEGIAARRYWKRLFGKSFQREPELPGINSFLNYGYAIIRAAVCRNIAAKGLLPELGIHHHNTMNPFCLADDLMEPYRPYVDRIVLELNLLPDCELNPQYKKALIQVLNVQTKYEDKKMHLSNCIALTVHKLACSFMEKKNLLDYPEIDALRLQTDVADGDV